MEIRRLLTGYALLIILIASSLLARYFILGGLSVTTFSPAPPLTGVIAPSLSNLSSKGSLPVEGKDYVIQSTRYFDNKTYAVIIVGVEKEGISNSSLLVLQNLNGAYKVILGPGTAFSNLDVQSLPTDVTQYLNSKALIYEPSN